MLTYDILSPVFQCKEFIIPSLLNFKIFEMYT